MKRLVTLSKDLNIKVNSSITEFLTPDFVYLEVDKEDTFYMKQKKVKKNDLLFFHQGKNVYSPISGKIEHIIKQQDYFGNEKTYLKIKNNFQEEDSYEGSLNTTMILTTDISLQIKKSKLDFSRFLNKNSLILNGLFDEPYLATIPFLHKYHAQELLMMLDAFATSFSISNVILYVKEVDRESIESFLQFLNTYPSIKLEILPDFYPLAHPVFFPKYLKLTPDDEVITSLELFQYYYEIVKARKQDFVYVTLTGDAITNPQVLKVKIGTKLEDVISILSFETENYDVYVNGLLNGVKSSISSIIFSTSILGIYFMKRKEVLVSPCVHCGKCSFVCPLRCNPYQSVLSSGKIRDDGCISCGLCTFICPSNIAIKEYLKGDVYEK